MLEKRLEVKAEGKKAYDIVIRDTFGGLAEELKPFETEKRKLCIVTERNVAGYYLNEVQEILETVCARVDIFIFQAGEASKNLDTVSQLYRYLIRHEYDRKDMLIALGGGVVGDLTGFTAATYLRGIDFCAGADQSAVAGGQQHRRKDRRGFSVLQKYGRRILYAKTRLH